MKKTFVRILCLCLIAAIAVPALSFADDRAYMYVNSYKNGLKVKLRSDPWQDGDSNVITKIPHRQKVLVYKYNKQKTWAYIETDNPDPAHIEGVTVKGWMAKEFLSKKDPGKWKGNSDQGGDEGVVTLSDINRACKSLALLDAPYSAVVRTKKATNPVHLRWFPDTSASWISTYLAGTELTVLAESKKWAQVRIVDTGYTGFILRDNVDPTEE